MKNKRLLGLMMVFAFAVSFISFAPYVGPVKALDPYDHRTAQFNIVVLPDGRVALTHGYYRTYNVTDDSYHRYRISEDTIVYNYTDPYQNFGHPSNVTYLTFEIDIANNIADVSFDLDMEPFSPASKPNASDPAFDVDVSATYSNGVFTITTSADMSNINITSLLNLTMLIPDFTMSLTLGDGEIDGTLTLQPGGFIGTGGVTLVVHGERTEITLSGDGSVLYLGDAFNESHLIYAKSLIENLTGPQSQNNTLLNMTSGMLNATQATFNYVNVGGGATIDLDLTISNTTTGILQTMLPYMLNSTFGNDNVTALMFYGIEKSLNETSGTLTVSYDESAKTVDVTGTVTLDFGAVIDFMKGPITTSYWFPPWNVAPILNSDVPDVSYLFDQVEVADVYMDHLTSLNIALQFDSGANTLNATGSASINNMHTILDEVSTALNQTVDYWYWNENVSIVELHREEVVTPQGSHTYAVQKYSGGSDAIAYYMYNDPSMFPLSDSKVWSHIDNWWGEFNSTWARNVTFSFNNFDNEYGYILNQGFYDIISGVIVEVDQNWVNSSWYDLDDLFSNWVISASLGTNDTFSVTVSGGSNGTHHTILSTESVAGAPNATVDDPDGNLLVAHWYNVTPDELTGLLFSATTGGISGGYIDPNVISESNPFVMYDPFLGVQIEVSNISDPIGITMGVATDPAAPGGGLTPVGFYVNVTTTSPVTYVEGWITFYYTDAMIQALGLNEETLEVFWYNTTSSSYEALSPVIRNTEENWAKGYLSHFSVFVLLGLPAGLPLWLILTIVAVVVVAAGVAGFALLRRRGVPTEGKLKTDTEGWAET